LGNKWPAGARVPEARAINQQPQLVVVTPGTSPDSRGPRPNSGSVVVVLRVNLEREYSNIHGLIYFNPRMPVRLPGRPEAGMFWASHTRDKDASLFEFLHALSNAWTEHLAALAPAASETFTIVGGMPQMEALRFYGSTPKLPRATATSKKK
jgi:hypothetical protein